MSSRLLTVAAPSAARTAFWYRVSLVAGVTLAMLWTSASSFPATLQAADPAEKAASKVTGVDPAKVQAARAKATAFLKAAQNADGSWTNSKAPGVSGLVTYALLRSGVSAEDPVIKKAIAHLLTFRQKDGGIYNAESAHGNYETSIVLLALTAANTDKRYQKELADALAYLKKAQWDSSEGIAPSDIKYGGAGYGRTGDRPDLSNTVYLLEALKAAGVKEDDEAMKNAIIFVSRCQNLESEANTTPFAGKINDGGFYYTPAAGGSSMAGKTENGGLRSYGSMTYAGLKSFIYAGLKADDPRVKAALTWISKHYTVKENPGMGQQGLYYYYHTYSKALAAVGKPEVMDDKGTAHNWRVELGEQILSLQKDDGSWVNMEARWFEGDPNMATSLALLSLAYCVAP